MSVASDLTNLPCPICSQETHRLFAKHGYWIRSCNVCRHRFAELVPSGDHIERVYADHYFQGGEAGYLNYLDEGPILTARGRRYSRLLAKFMAPGTLLDVGSAAGFMLKGFIDSGWKGRGIEPNPCMAAYARKRLSLSVDTGTLEQYPGSDRYDLVTMFQIVAHFIDPKKALEAAAQLTRPGGFWLIETWNKESWTARIFGRRWHEYSPPSVLHWFSPEGLQRLAGQFGFHEIARRRTTKWINADHAKSLLRYKCDGSRLDRLAASVTSVIPDHLAVPYLMDDLFWALFQKS